MLFAFASLLVFARRLMHGCGKARVPASATAAARNHETLVRMSKLENLFAGLVVVDDGSDRNFQNNTVTIASSFVRTFAVTSALRRVLGIETEMDQRVVALAGFHDNVPALAAVSAGRTAARNKFLPPEGHAAISAVAGLNPNFRLIDKHKNVAGHYSLAVSRRPIPVSVVICCCAAQGRSRKSKNPRPAGRGCVRELC